MTKKCPANCNQQEVKVMKFHVVLLAGVDADIIAFKNYLPRRKFNEAVIHILRHAVSGKSIVRTMYFDIDLLAPKTHTKIDLPADLVKQCKKLFKGPFTTGVKQEIRKFIQYNRVDTTQQRYSVAELAFLFDEAEKEMERLKVLHVNHPEKHRALLRKYDELIDDIVTMTTDKAHPSVTFSDGYEREE